MAEVNERDLVQRFVEDLTDYAIIVLDFSGNILTWNAGARILLGYSAGEVVGIFPEGKLTESGELNPFRSGVQEMIATTPVPVVPMALRGLWGSFFSRSSNGKAIVTPAPRRKVRRDNVGWVVFIDSLSVGGRA